MVKSTCVSKATQVEDLLLCKENLTLSKPDRLKLLLKVHHFPIVNKRTSAKMQLKEMKELYELLALLLAKLIPDEKAEFNCMCLELIQGVTDSIIQDIPEELKSGFKAVGMMEILENNVRKIDNLFYEYFHKYPDIYEDEMLDQYSFRITDMLDNARYKLRSNPGWQNAILTKWGFSEIPTLM